MAWWYTYFRFVLEHKIEELKQQIMPKDDMIVDLRSQIDAMEDELNDVTRSQTEMAVQLDDTKVRSLVCETVHYSPFQKITLLIFFFSPS